MTIRQDDAGVVYRSTLPNGLAPNDTTAAERRASFFLFVGVSRAGKLRREN